MENILLAGAISLLTSIITTWLNHIWQVRRERMKRKYDEDKARLEAEDKASKAQAEQKQREEQEQADRAAAQQQENYRQLTRGVDELFNQQFGGLNDIRVKKDD
ncbi:MAG: hypothetical protein MUE40_19635 [Anaerolineae bacterium]|nr:hypothetical protein [Anaerolineae bacterium]